MNFRLYVTMALVAALHAGAIASVMFVQGCRSPLHRVGGPGELQTLDTQAPMPPLDASLSTTPSPAFKPTYTPPPPEHKPAPSTPLAASTYIIQSGDTLGLIARKHGVSATELAAANNLANPNKIRVGQKLKIPAGNAAPSASAQKSAAPAAAKPGAAEGSYVVEAGDNLSKIAARFGVTAAALREANHLESDKIITGRKLVIPSGARKPTPPPAEPKQGSPLPPPVVIDNPEDAGVPPVSKPVAHPELQTEGESTLLPSDETSPVAKSMIVVHTVLPGDTMESVARLYLVTIEKLASANGLATDAVLTPGQRLTIP